MTSTQFTYDKKQDEITAQAADFIVFEPFILENKGKVLSVKTLTDLAVIINAVKVAKPETTINL